MNLIIKLSSFKLKLLIVLVVSILVAGCLKGDNWHLYDSCIREATARLKSPKTAEFSALSETRILQDVKAYPNDGILRAEWTVTGFVDSENSFGANIRTSFTCKFKQRQAEFTFVSINF